MRLLILLLLMPVCFGLTVNPSANTIENVKTGNTYQFIFTLINNDPTSYDISIVPAAQSEYLSDYARIEPSTFTIEPNENKNVKVSVSMNGLSPEKHSLLLNIMSSVKLSEYRLSFTIPGDRVNNLIIEDLQLSKDTVDVLLFNKGNVIARGKAIIDIDGYILEKDVMVMPDKPANISFAHAVDGTVKAKVSYNGLESNSIEKEISKNKVELIKNNYVVYPIILIAILSMIMILFFVLRKPYKKKLEGIEARVKEVNSHYDRLAYRIDETNKNIKDFVSEANDWLGKPR